MAAQPSEFHLSPDDELALALKRAARDHQLVLVNTGEEVLEISAVSTRPVVADDEMHDDEPDSILDLIGMLDSGEPSDVAQFKDQYLADAIDHRRR